MALYQRQYVGKYAVVQYGSRLLNADSYRVSISGEVIDVTNISVFGSMQVRLPPKRIDPNGLLPPTSPLDHEKYFANHGTPTSNLWGGKRSYKVNVTGKTYKLGDGINNYLPNFGDYVKIAFTDAAPGVGTHPRFICYCIVTEVEFANDIKGYQSWTLNAEGTTGITVNYAGDFADNSIVPEGL